MSSVIKVESLAKKYLIGHQNSERYVTFRSAFTNAAKNLGRGLFHPSQSSGSKSEEFWALKDITFEVKQGDRVGIIGRNGAGKSTLLKILSRITEPTSGRVSIKGRVSSLLEVGTGFHPELTGRENIFLNGAILGMHKAEIRRKFDEIVAFAEIEKFLDTPVKHYSSGMYVRLAFAVAAHLEPDILIVDEVLAVGDAQFQKKCLGKMKDVSSNEGRTVLFVSHQMNAIEQLCSSALLLDQGSIKKSSNDVRSIITSYLYEQENQLTISEWINSDKKLDNPWFKPLKFYISDQCGNKAIMPLKSDSQHWVHIEGEIEKLDPALCVGYAIYSDNGYLLYWSYQTDSPEEQWPMLSTGHNILRSRLPKRFFNEGAYRIELISGLHYRKWICQPGKNAPSICFTIQGGLSDSPYWMKKRPGMLAPVIDWQRSNSSS